MACALAPAPEIPSRAQRSHSAANEARPPCPAPAPLKVKLKIKIGGKLADKKGPTAAPEHSTQDAALHTLERLAQQCRKAAGEELPPKLPAEWAPFPQGQAGGPSMAPSPLPQPEAAEPLPQQHQQPLGASEQPAAPLGAPADSAREQQPPAQPQAHAQDPPQPGAADRQDQQPFAQPLGQPAVLGAKRGRQGPGQLVGPTSAGPAVDCHVPKRARSSLSAGDQQDKQASSRKRRSSSLSHENRPEKCQAEPTSPAQPQGKAPSKPSYSRLRPDGHDEAGQPQPSHPADTPRAPLQGPPSRQSTPQLQTQPHATQQRPEAKPRPAEAEARPAEVGKSSDDSSQDVHHPAAPGSTVPAQHERGSTPHGRPHAPTPLPAHAPAGSRAAKPARAGRPPQPGGSTAGMLKLLSMAAALPLEDHWILQMNAATLHKKAVDSKRQADNLKQDTNTGNLKVFLAYVAAGVHFMAWCCKLEEDTLSAMPRSGELRELVRAHDQTITLLTQTLRECPPSSKDGSHQLGRILLERVIAALQLRTFWLYRSHLKLDCTLLSKPAPAQAPVRSAAAEAATKLWAKGQATPVARSPSSNTSTTSAASGLAASQGGAQMGSAGAAGANPSAMPPSSPAIARAEAERRLALRSSSALQAQERVHSTGRELQALAAAPDLSEKAGSTLGALAAMCLDGTGADLRCSVICAKLALDADVFRPR